MKVRNQRLSRYWIIIAIVVVIASVFTVIALLSSFNGEFWNTTTIIQTQSQTTTCYTTAYSDLFVGTSTWVQCNIIVYQNTTLPTEYQTITSFNIINATSVTVTKP